MEKYYHTMLDYMIENGFISDYQYVFFTRTIMDDPSAIGFG